MDGNDGLKEKAAQLVKKAAFKDGISLTPAQESMAVKLVRETFQQMVNEGKTITNLNHTTVTLLLKTIKSLYP